MLLLLLPCCVFGADVKITNLKVEYTETPLGIDVQYPRFNWQMVSLNDKTGNKQVAYQLTVTDEAGLVVWNSGKVRSDVSLNIKYAGKPLTPTTRYTWVVVVWDHENIKHTEKSWFETGLMRSDPEHPAWSDAKWIGGGDDDLVLYAPYLPVFKINFSIQLDERSRSTHAGFVYGANDPRLMDKNKNLYNLQHKKDSAYVIVDIDISPLHTKRNAVLNIYRVGYHPGDKKEIPFKTYEINPALIGEGNKYNTHDISIASNLGHTQIYVNGLGKENLVADFNMNPIGGGGDFITFPVLAEIGFCVPEGQSAAFSKIEIRNYRSPSNILFAERFDTAGKGIFSAFGNIINAGGNRLQVSGKKGATFFVADPSRNSTPMLRTAFTSASSKIVKARLYATARGIYEVYMNGKRIGNDYFNPGMTQYNKTHLYQTFDVTDYIQPGKNVLGALLAEGWWSGGITYMGQFWNFFGDRQSFLAKLVITYADGKSDVIVTEPSTWRYFNDGPVRYGSFFQGEVYDATKESLIAGWSTAAYDDAQWKKAKEVSLDNHISTDEVNRRFNMSMVDDYTKFSLRGQFGNTVKKVKVRTAQSVETVRPGVFVYDMGQNMVGVPEINLVGVKPGTKIVLRFAEVKYPALAASAGNAGMIMLENIRAAMAQDIYITKGGEETIQPRFTFHGYRFVEITGIEKSLSLEAVKGNVISSIDQVTSHYETSNAKVNKLWENITWSTLGNFLSIPTDCPQRNERLGWSGDISVYSRTATYLSNAAQFLRRHMQAMRDVQREDGRFSDVAPLGGGFGGVLWGSAGITVAWESYLQYGDREILEEHYDAMKKYVDYIVTKNIDPATNILVQENPRSWANLGDWLGPEQDKNDNSLLWEAYFIFDLEIMKNIANILNKKEDEAAYSKLYTERKKFFNKIYFDQQTKQTIHSGFKQHKTIDLTPGDLMNTQASYVLPLAFNIVHAEDKNKVVANLVQAINEERIADDGKVCPPYSLMTGFIGTAWINKALSDNGRSDVAYRLLQQTTFPSWLYPVEQGATTIWERLNSFTHTDGFGGNNGMNSFNHYSFGAVGAWLCSYSLGISRDESSPGFKHFVLRPEPDATGAMTYAKGYYDAMYGRIESSWEKENNGYRYRFIIPANTTATLLLPADDINKIFSNGILLKTQKHIKYLGQQHMKQVFELPSGTYLITVKTE